MLCELAASSNAWGGALDSRTSCPVMVEKPWLVGGPSPVGEEQRGSEFY
jgi:hypothetical protein